jgi:hypothetical protein
MRPEECKHGMEVKFVGKHFPNFHGGKVLGEPYLSTPRLGEDGQEHETWSVVVRPPGRLNQAFAILLDDLEPVQKEQT